MEDKDGCWSKVAIGVGWIWYLGDHSGTGIASMLMFIQSSISLTLLPLPPSPLPPLSVSLRPSLVVVLRLFSCNWSPLPLSVSVTSLSASLSNRISHFSTNASTSLHPFTYLGDNIQAPPPPFKPAPITHPGHTPAPPRVGWGGPYCVSSTMSLSHLYFHSAPLLSCHPPLPPAILNHLQFIISQWFHQVKI